MGCGGVAVGLLLGCDVVVGSAAMVLVVVLRWGCWWACGGVAVGLLLGCDGVVGSAAMGLLVGARARGVLAEGGCGGGGGVVGERWGCRGVNVGGACRCRLGWWGGAGGRGRGWGGGVRYMWRRAAVACGAW